MAKILVVDDDTELTTVIAGYLTGQNYTVETVTDGRAALDVLAVSGFDLIVLDLDMPFVSGTEVCRKLRENKNLTPVIMLTGRSTIDDKASGLDCGADDYLTKPFNLKELSARVKALLRRATSVYTTLLKCGDLELDTANHTVSKGGKAIHLIPIDFALLEFFMSHAGQTFSNETLLSRVWTSDTEATDDAIRSAVRRLRKVIDDGDNEGASYIENHRRVGYRFRPDLK